MMPHATWTDGRGGHGFRRCSGRRVIFVLSSIPGSAFPRLPVGGMPTNSFTPESTRCWARSAGTARAARCRAAGVRSAQVIVASLIATLYGITDEAHQAFTPLRSPDPFDVVADAVGGLLGAIACVVIVSRERAKSPPATVRCRR